MSDKKSFITAAITGLSNLTRLEVNTMVGNYTFNQDQNGANTTLKIDNTGERMCSQINLVTGDISTAMTEKFVSEYKDLRKYHMAREEQGHEIIKKNIEVLKQILDTITHFEEKKNNP
ncbi:MAG: hypothetical protein WAO52_07700 [Prolixibacteraceae bacterium]